MTNSWATCLFKNADVQHVLDHPEIYSTSSPPATSPSPTAWTHPNTPPSIAVNDKYFTPERLEKFAPVIRDAVKTLIAELPRGEEVDVMQGFGQAYAMRVQNAFMGWPACLEQPLTEWIERTASPPCAATAKKSLRSPSNSTATSASCSTNAAEDAAAGNPKDVTAELLTDTVQLPGEEPRTMTDEEIVSLIRNWTVGELSTVSRNRRRIRQLPGTKPRRAGPPARIPRRRQHSTTAVKSPSPSKKSCDSKTPSSPTAASPLGTPELGGRTLPAGSRVTINWASANRDEDAFEDALTYNPHRDQSRNLVYGDGIHVCPGAPLARLELRILLEELLRGTESIEIADESEKPATVNAVYPVSGYSVVRAIFN